MNRSVPAPHGHQAPVVQRIRLRYAKRGPLRFTSHRDIARAFERAVRRAGVPIAYSQGFSPHPKISYVGAAPTGAASEAEYLELGLAERVDPGLLRAALDAALSPGLDVLEAVVAADGTGLAERIDAARWLVALDGVDDEAAGRAVDAFLRAEEVLVERLTKQGRRRFDCRAAVVRLRVWSLSEPEATGNPDSRPEPAGPQESGLRGSGPSGSGQTGPVSASPVPDVTPVAAGRQPCAILDLIVRQVTPSVRPDDVLAGLSVVADLQPPAPPRATRLAQGRLTQQGRIVDPLTEPFEVPVPVAATVVAEMLDASTD
jgi:radical SAM-linked protein